MSLLVLLFAASACASGGDVDPQETTPDDAGIDAADTSDTAEAGDADVRDADADNCGQCCPGERTCTDQETVGICNDRGNDHDEQPCGDGQICEDGHCIDEPICDPGQTQCHDATHRLVCRSSGTAWRTEPCDAGQACLDGDCLDGAPNGAECTDDSDCAGGKCRCGSSENCDPDPTRPFCTTPCTPGSCADGEVCAEASGLAGVDYNHCLPGCDQTCSMDGLSCIHVPTQDSGDWTYEPACYSDSVVDVGQPCTSDSECPVGECLHDYYDAGFCTFSCTGDCPDRTACVELDGAHFCTPRCPDDDPSVCPHDKSVRGWDVVCEFKVTYDNGGRRVCVAP
jgi:hypothetical protein